MAIKMERENRKLPFTYLLYDYGKELYSYMGKSSSVWKIVWFNLLVILYLQNHRFALQDWRKMLNKLDIVRTDHQFLQL